MKTTRIVILLGLICASAGIAHAEKVIMLIEASRDYLPMVRAEAGVEAFYLAARKDDPNTFVFYEIYKSQAAQDFHLAQDFTKKFLAILKSAQVGDRVRSTLTELP